MPRGTLPNFNIYFNRLLDYARLCNLSVFTVKFLTKEEDDEEDLGVFIPSARAINLGHNLTQKEMVAVFLHELGHFEDDNTFTIGSLTNQAYGRLNQGKKINREQKQAIINCEQRAWKFGRVLAKKLQIPLGLWYDKQERAGLKTYRSIKT